MIQSMTATLVMWLLLGASLVGLGGAVVRLACGAGSRSLVRSFWIGWAVWLGALQISHGFMGLANGWITAVLCVVGITCLGWFEREKLAERIAGLSGTGIETRISIAAFVLFTLWLANRAQGPLLSVDSGLYHLTAIKWAAEHPLAYGLGNLHGRLAFNNASFLWLASLDAWPHWFRGFNVGQSLLALAAIAHLLRRRVDTSTSSESAGATSMFHAILLLPLFYAATVMHVSSTGPDWAVLALGCVLASELWGWLTCESSEASSERMLGMTAVAAAGIAVKLSFAAFGLAAIGIAAARIFHRDRTSPVRVLAPALVFAALILIPWSMRSVALSGYPAYPSTLAGQDVPWRVPTERAEAEMRWIRSWARAPGKTPDEVLGKTDWIGPWITSRLRNSDSVALFVIPGALLAVALALGGARRSPEGSPALLVAAPGALSIVAWFVSAPDPRFLGASLWVCAAAILAGGSTHLPRGTAWNRYRIAHWITALVLLGFAVRMGSVVGGAIIRPGRDDGRYPVRQIATKNFETDSGLNLNVPRDGDACWEARLPCTPYPAPRLGLRNADDLASGFELE